MNRKNKMWLATVCAGLIAVLLLAGCQNPLNGGKQGNELDGGNTSAGIPAVNYQELSVFRAAAASLKAAGAISVAPEQIQPSHSYVRFTVNNQSEMAVFQQAVGDLDYDTKPFFDEALVPGDGQGVDGNTEYPVNYYMAWPLTQTMPTVPVTILSQVVLEADPSWVASYDTIASQAETACLAKQGITVDAASRALGKWIPSGTITLQDDTFGSVPLYRVEVRLRSGFHWNSVYTNANGYFRSNEEYRNKVNHSIRWQYPGGKFDVLMGKTGQATYDGPNQEAPWNLHIVKGTHNWIWATVYRAGVYYLLQERIGLDDNPFDNISIEVRNEKAPKDEGGNYDSQDRDITIWRLNYYTGGEQKSDYMFMTVVHEMAHAQRHKAHGSKNDWNGGTQIGESWAVYVAYKLMMDAGYKVGIFDFQGYRWASTDVYNPALIDMEDTLNQATDNKYNVVNKEALYDPVFGYSFAELSSIILNQKVTTLDQLRDALIQKKPWLADVITHYMNQFKQVQYPYEYS